MNHVTTGQELLWALPDKLGHVWWYTVAVIAGCASVTMFLYMIMNEKLSSLLISRTAMCMGFMFFALTPLNSGWMPWGALLVSAGGLHASFLIATDWCNRHDKWEVIRLMMMRVRKHAHKQTRSRSSH